MVWLALPLSGHTPCNADVQREICHSQAFLFCHIHYTECSRVISDERSSPSGPVSLLSLWTSRITQANSRKHPEFSGRLNSINNKAELYQHLKDENGLVISSPRPLS